MPTQTPGPRRFAPPPPSSSSARNSAFSGASARFARPSQPTSSPFTRTPFSSTARKDEIEVDDDSDSDYDELDNPISTTPFRHLNPAKSSRQSLNDTVSGGSGKKEHKQSSLNPEIGLPTKGPKRQKVSHFHPDESQHPSDILHSSPPNSSPAPDLGSINGELENETSHSPQSSPADPTIAQDVNGLPDPDPDRHSSPLQIDEESPGKEFATPKMRISRFRNPLIQSTQANTGQYSATATSEQPLPSFQSRLLAASTASSPGPHLRGPHPSLDYVLPDAFSPSRRRGHHEYIEHGHAETVRSWVLDIATRTGVNDSLHTTRQRASNNDETNSLSITKILHLDRDDRFAIVSMTDSAESFMLIDTDPKPPPQAVTGITPKGRLERLHEGSRIVIKGGRVSNWMLNTTADPLEATSESSRTDSTSCRVVVLWDLIH